ncbi:hypothetical protein ASF87_16720 [Microbacterium sp. Leaf161]|uniref:hypothetical protein n=1 Tax=Microbacterium sp. Leaf161 TaxID=1736281 RepID=UPI0006F26488|nr:hypothetical protein [Microbacterium sp. Leaf161]KQR43433.1 hypothetical protein ASF87_16720 [Microbacterium sp. Leaf161]
MAGRISLSVDSPLRTMLIAARSVPAEVQKRIATETKAAAQPIWFAEVREGAHTRLEQRVLADSARVGATQRNVFLRSGGVGTLRSGTPVNVLASAAEFGMGADKKIATRSRTGTDYTRRAGSAFPSPRRRGPVYTAAGRSLVRFASLWIQTAVRTMLDKLEGK